MDRVGIICTIALLSFVFTACEKRAEYFAQFLPESFEEFEAGETLSPDSPTTAEEPQPEEPQPKEPQPKEPQPKEPEHPEQVAKPEEYDEPEEGLRPPTSHEEQGFFAKLFQRWSQKTPHSESDDEPEGGEPEQPASAAIVMEGEASAPRPQDQAQENQEPVAKFTPEPIVIIKAKAKAKAIAKLKGERPKRERPKRERSMRERPKHKRPERSKPRKQVTKGKGASLRLAAYTPRQKQPKTPLAAVHTGPANPAKAAGNAAARRAYRQGLAAFARNDKDRAHEFFLLACSGGYFTACNRYGFAQMSQGNVKGARNYFKVACHNGVARGCNNLGWAYEQVSKFAKAKLYYSQACAKLHEQGCANYLRLRSLLKTKPYLKSVLKHRR